MVKSEQESNDMIQGAHIEDEIEGLRMAEDLHYAHNRAAFWEGQLGSVSGGSSTPTKRMKNAPIFSCSD
jgi:hypothetical protein